MIDPRRSARLTLLALRSSVPASTDFRTDVVRLGHRGRLLELDDAVDALAALPKPVGFWTSVEEEILVINFFNRRSVCPSGGWGSLEKWGGR